MFLRAATLSLTARELACGPFAPAADEKGARAGRKLPKHLIGSLLFIRLAALAFGRRRRRPRWPLNVSAAKSSPRRCRHFQLSCFAQLPVAGPSRRLGLELADLGSLMPLLFLFLRLRVSKHDLLGLSAQAAGDGINLSPRRMIHGRPISFD